MNLDHVSHRLFQLAFVALALFIPFSIAGANIAIGFGLLAWLLAAIAALRGDAARVREPGRLSILRDPMLLASTLLAVSALPSVFMSENLTRAVYDWRSYWLLTIYFLVAANLAARGMREAAYWTLFASATISCLVAFVQRAGGIDIWILHLSGKHRVESTLFTMTFAGVLYQAIILNLAVALRKTAEWRRSLVLWAGLAIQLVALILTVTRGAWVALFAGLVTVCILVRNKTVVALSTAALAIILVFAFVTARDTGRNVSPWLLVQEVDIHAGTRLVLWDIAWDLFRAHPVLGVGMGDYSTEADKLVGDRTVTTTTDTHNVYLQVLATRGIIGFLPFVFFWWVVFRSLFRLKTRSAKGTLEWHYAVGAIGATVALLFGALTENNVDDEEVFIAYMFILGLVRSVEYASPAHGRSTSNGRGTGDTSG